MAPSPHSTRAAIINRGGSPKLLNAYSTRSGILNPQTASNHLGAYSTRPIIVNEYTASGKLSAYNIRSDAMKLQSASDKLSAYGTLPATTNQQSASDKLSAYSAGSATTDQQSISDKLSAYGTGSAIVNQQSASNKLSAYSVSSSKRNRYSDVLHVGQHSITRGDECLDEDCSNFCQSSKGKSSKTELDCSQDDFSLNMDGVLNAFGPFGLGSLPTIPEHAASSNVSPATAPSLRDLGITTSNPAISDPGLLVYPDLRKRVGRYFETRKPTPEGWTWSVDDTPNMRSYAPTHSTVSVALTDSSTIASGSVTELSQADPSRPQTPQMGPLQMALAELSHVSPLTPQIGRGPLQMAIAGMGPPEMDYLTTVSHAVMSPPKMNHLIAGNGIMPPPEMDHFTAGHGVMALPGMDHITVEPGKTLDPIAVIGKMREIQTEGVQPFGPSRFLNHPYGNPSGNPNGNYLGTMSAASNQMTNLPDHMNTCIWVEGAPADLSYFEMLRSIRGCGKVYSVHINPPKEKHYTAAAKIAFCTRIGAERFFQQAHTAIGIIIRGRRICVRWNRNKYRENYNRAESRVLRISGPSQYVNFQVLGEYFARLFYFNLIWVEQVSPGVMIWEFSSILAQAHSAKQAIEREPAMMNMVRIKYERDPCE